MNQTRIPPWNIIVISIIAISDINNIIIFIIIIIITIIITITIIIIIINIIMFMLIIKVAIALDEGGDLLKASEQEHLSRRGHFIKTMYACIPLPLLLLLLPLLLP